MSWLAKSRKVDLITVIDEMGLTLPENTKIVNLCKTITEAKGFDEDFIKNLLSTTVIEREKLELAEKQRIDREHENAERIERLNREREDAERAKQLEREDAERAKQLEREDTERARQLERERQDAEREQQAEREKLQREFELQKMQLELEAKKAGISGSSSTIKGRDLIKLMSSYNVNSDIGIYLALFERQISRAGVPKPDWTAYLLSLLPLEIVNLVSREPDEVANDYEQVKKLLLLRFKLNFEQFRQKFVVHKKLPSQSYRDFAFELSQYFEQWIAGIKVDSFEGLKELIITDQLKRKLPNDIREHFVDDLPQIKRVDDLVKKLEDYETARCNLRKTSGREMSNQGEKFGKPLGKKSDQSVPSPRTNTTYNRPRIKCFQCAEYGHTQYSCPKKKDTLRDVKNKPPERQTTGSTSRQITESTPKESNGTFIANPADSVKKLYKTVKVLGKNVNSLVDSGSDVTAITQEFYNEIGSPPLTQNNVRLLGISTSEVQPLGFFSTKIKIDDFEISTDIYVLESMSQKMLLGMNLINKFDFALTQNGLRIFGMKQNLELGASLNPPISGLNSMQKTETALQKQERVRQKTFNPKDGCMNECVIRGDTSCVRGSLFSADGCERANTSFQPKGIFLSDSLFEMNINEIDVSHIVDRDFRSEIENLVTNYKPNKTKHSDVKLSIVLQNEIPIYQRPRRLAMSEKNIVNKQIEEWLKEGVIRDSVSPWAAPIVICRKKDGSPRICVDFRSINKKVLRDHYPLPLIDEIINHLENSEVFTSIDLKNGFFHVSVDEASTKYTSFVTQEGQYEFLKMPFGLCTSPTVFQRYISNVFRDLVNDKTLTIYMDDMIVASKNEEEGIAKLKRVFERASEYGLEINFKKCQFLKRKIEFLGYVIEKGTIKPSIAKTLAVRKFPIPTNVKQVQSFLGLTGYFRRFIPQYSKLAKPLSDLLRGNVKFKMGKEQLEAFQGLKEALTTAPVLHIYRQGSTLELHTDASSQGFGAVLLQKATDGKMNPVYYMSKKTTAQQEKYSSYELEVLAIVEALKKFRTYLLGTKFKIVTDCDAFKRTLNKKELAPKVARWALFLEEFDYDVVHRSGKQMQHVDALSRNAIMVITRAGSEVTAKIASAQEEDEHIKMIKTMVQEGEKDDHFIKNDVLYKYVEGKELLVIPQAMQAEIIQSVHNQGHFAAAKTEEVLKKFYYIPKARKMVESIIANCVQCILCNRKRGKGEGLLNPIPKEDTPLSTYHIDHIGPLASTNKQYQHILTVIDAFTKFTWCYPCKSTSTQEAIAKLKAQQTIFGNPSRIISDKGSAFKSQDFADYCKQQNIEHVQITTGIPRGNGQVERIHNVIIPVLAKLSIDDPTKWYKYVSDLQRVLNSTVSRSTKYTPFELMIGVKMKNQNDQKILDILEEEYVNTTMMDRNQMREEAKANILTMQQENRRQYNRKRKKAHEYKINDLVAIQRTQFGSGLKLRPKFFGPYRVAKVKFNDRYDVVKVGEHDGPNITSSAADHMKLWSTSVT